jgi:hypothetical protein
MFPAVRVVSPNSLNGNFGSFFRLPPRFQLTLSGIGLHFLIRVGSVLQANLKYFSGLSQG